MAVTFRLPPGFPSFVVTPNPLPALVTDEMWAFKCAVMALEPADFEYSGTYTLKSGYHSTVEDNLRRWPGTYSVRDSRDLNGIRTKGRALDVSSKSAKRGSYGIMAKYGARMRAAAKAKDPRVRHWVEVLGQFDTDTPPEGIFFSTAVEREPDDTHSWHFHWSIFALYVALIEAYEGMLSVLFGESLTDYLARMAGMADGALPGDYAPMTKPDFRNTNIRVVDLWMGESMMTTALDGYGGGGGTARTKFLTMLGAKVDTILTMLGAAQADLDDIQARVGVTVMTDEALEKFVEILADRIEGATGDVVRDALRDALSGARITVEDEPSP